MALFKNDHDLKDQLEAAQAEVVEHEAVIAKRESDIITVTEQMATINSQLETVSAELETVTAANAEMTAELEAVKRVLDFDQHFPLPGSQIHLVDGPIG